MKSYKKFLALPLVMVLSLFLNGCLITEVDQPQSVEAGGVFTSTITVSDMNAEQTNAHKGVLAILVPEDWSFIDGTYDTPMGTGILELDPTTPPVWGDIDTVITPTPGMKWINLLSDTGYLHDANVVYEATVNLQVGTTTGTFPIGYLVTVNTMDMLVFLNDQDYDQPTAGADTSMNHMVTITAPVGVREEILQGIPSSYNLSQNYPNPFNPSTTIKFAVVEGTDVQLSIYDASGKEVKQLVNGFRQAGNYSVTFDASDLSSGIYYYRISMNGFTSTNKMVLLK
jgi:hypothetical protein